MCDTSDYAVGTIMGQIKNTNLHTLHYTRKVLNEAQINYFTIEKEMMAIMYVLENFRSYLIGLKIIIHIDHEAIKYLITKYDSKPRLIK